MHECIAIGFRRPEPGPRAQNYLRRLLGPVEGKNSWRLAEWVGDVIPDRVQRPLTTCILNAN